MLSLVPERRPADEPRPTAAPGRAAGDARRRAVLAALSERDGPTTLDALARTVAERTTTMEVSAVRVDLHHVHLPVLEQAGLVAYDSDDGVVALADDIARTDGTVETPPASDTS